MVLSVAVSACLMLCGCGGAYKTADSYESFMALVGKNAKIELTADIDFGGAEVTPIALKELNGNGHTIKNVKVLPGINLRNATNMGHYISLLGEHTKVVKNVKFDNITIDDSQYAKYASFVAAACLEMDGVTVTNSTMRLESGQYVGGLTCALEYRSLTSDFERKGAAPTNCAIEDCTITASSTECLGGICQSGSVKNSHAKNLTIKADGAQNVGGIVGTGNSLENCYAEKLDISVKSYSSDRIKLLNVGGMAGSLISAVTSTGNCVKNSVIEVNAPYYTENKITGVEGVAGVAVGGIAGAGVHIENSGAENNRINVFCTGDVFEGGLIGQIDTKSDGAVKQCYAVNNNLTASGFKKEFRADKYSAIERALGGLIGYAKNVAVSSCYAYANSVDDKTSEINEAYYGDSYIYAGGLIGFGAAGNAVSLCAVDAERLHGYNSGDSALVFGNKTKNLPATCYTDFTEEQWLDGETVPAAIEWASEHWALSK